MGSDRARISYDPNQQYRSVVMQQGRVTLEADFNEELAIAGEELREETLDIVGPSGTPDDGYLITPLTADTSASPPISPFDFSVHAGTMYVGGLRVATPSPVSVPDASTSASKVALKPVRGAKRLGAKTLKLDVKSLKSAKALDPNFRYTSQTDWLDHFGDHDWVDISTNNPPTNEFVYLFLREQEISAVEDSDLKDVALGGPDTAQRTRLIQHIVRLTADATCNAGLDAASKVWQNEGLTFDSVTMRLQSNATLQVGFSTSASTPNPCNPQATGGFLGADNQLIRVQISGTDQGNLQFVWGYDDASFLYRLDLDKNNTQLLHLQSRPVDASHMPRVNQAVEVLRSAAQLSNGEYVASLSGIVLTLDKAYDPDTQLISLPAPLTKLPDEYYDPLKTPRVFLRVWEQELGFTPGTAVNLGNTGLTVTLQAANNFHLGDYWLFAVRPSTPQQVYPERYLNDFQPADGPRMWACPLAAITWSGQTGTAQDCRQSFSPLVDLVTVEHEGKFVGTRSTLNFTGPGVTAVTDNPALKRVDIQITGGGGSGESSPTLLLFPYCRADVGTVKNAFRDDTFIAISSTTADPFGPQQPPGAVTLYCYGTGLSSSPLLIPLPPPLSPGQMTPFSLLDKLVAAGLKTGIFEGYVIADCVFAGAYGFARVSRPNQGVNQNLILTDSYLAIVLPRPVPLGVSSLTPPTATVLVGGPVVTFTVNLAANVSTSTDLQISSSPSGLANIPSTVTVPAGSASTTFTASAIAAGTVTITVTLPGTTGSATATLTVDIVRISDLKIPAKMTISISGGTATGNVVLNGPAVTDATITLTSAPLGFLQVSSQVVIPKGSTTSPAFQITATRGGTGSITATFPPGAPVTKPITVFQEGPPPPPPPGPGPGPGPGPKPGPKPQ